MRPVSAVDCIPVSYFDEKLGINGNASLLYLGKASLRWLAEFWKTRRKKFIEKRDTATTSEARERAKDEIEYCTGNIKLLESLIRTEGETFALKPNIFERIIRIGTRVAVFRENPDRYVIGKIVKFKVVDDTVESVVVRSFDRDTSQTIELEFTPNKITMCTEEQFNYYRQDKDFYRFVLKYRFPMLTPSEYSIIDRMVAALPPVSPLR
ncbi:hypothetical protein IJG96_00995 [Candidatus Saccharibacteria bacterium]|nr:hypothetical protein [Candidatus Saccharibacteria bacterium]